jgi:hypothetical protein
VTRRTCSQLPKVLKPGTVFVFNGHCSDFHPTFDPRADREPASDGALRGSPDPVLFSLDTIGRARGLSGALCARGGDFQ